MTYTQLLLFFIPVWKWNRQYFVRMSCCGTVYTLDPAVGEAIARGENPEIRPADLVQVPGTGEVWQGGSTHMPAGYEDREAIRESSAPQNGGTHHRCVICGYETDEDFAFCPKCGQRF
jgi:hypothetical protein